MPTETLTSRQRVIRTLRRQPVDRYPIDLGCHPSTGISAFAYHNLRKHLGLSTDNIWLYDTVQFLASIDDDIRERFHIDTTLLEPKWASMHRWAPRPGYEFSVPTAYQPTQNATGDWIVTQGNRSMRMPNDGYFFDGDWLSNWGGLSEDQAIALYAREARRIYDETPYAINFTGYSYGPSFYAFFGGFEHAVAMLEDPDAVLADNEKHLARQIAQVGKIIDAFGPYIQLLSINADMGMQSGPMCRPSVMEQCVMPFIKRFCDFIHRNSDIKIFHHCCGSIRPLIPMLIDAGVDVLNPVQISAYDMFPTDLARDFGDKIVFWGGGCDTQNVLGASTPGQVAAHVRSTVAAFKPTRSFVFNQVHNIMGNVPPENIIALFDTGYAESFYQ